jgi:hypothetical protein
MSGYSDKSLILLGNLQISRPWPGRTLLPVLPGAPGRLDRPRGAWIQPLAPRGRGGKRGIAGRRAPRPGHGPAKVGEPWRRPQERDEPEPQEHPARRLAPAVGQVPPNRAREGVSGLRDPAQRRRLRLQEPVDHQYPTRFMRRRRRRSRNDNPRPRRRRGACRAPRAQGVRARGWHRGPASATSTQAAQRGKSPTIFARGESATPQRALPRLKARRACERRPRL